jgi:hypothetical protein
LRAQLINLVTFGTDPNGNLVVSPAAPGYTANLPGSLIEDISSTDTAALVLCDQARVELINSLTPFGANAFILNQLGQLFGIPIGTLDNVTVPVVFTGPPGFIVQRGFIVGDGNNTYVTQATTIIGANGATPQVNAVSPVAGSWAVAVGTVTQILTSVPSTIVLSVTNPLAGSGGNTQETEQAYRLRVLQACVATCQGTPAMLKTLLQAIPGVVAQQVAVQAVSGGLWKVICGGNGADPYAIALAIYQGVPALSSLTGSVMSIAAITQANPGQVTTVLNHGYTTGQLVTFSGVGGMTALNTGSYTATVVDQKNFTIGVNTSGYPAYSGGGQVLPNLRNNSLAIDDYPDSYTIPWVTPPKQTMGVALTWNATSSFAAASAISQLAQTAIINFVNAIPAGAPLNQYALEEAVLNAMGTLIDATRVSILTWVFTINGVVTALTSGTGLIQGDPESYFYTDPSLVTVTAAS